MAADLNVGPATRLRLRESLSADEQARAVRLHSPADGDRYTAGRGILRALLAQYVGIPAVDLSFCYNPQGIPALALGSGTVDWRFNVSHSDLPEILDRFTNTNCCQILVGGLLDLGSSRGVGSSLCV